MTATPNLPELKRLNLWVQEQHQLEPGARIWHQGSWVTLREETPMCQSAYCVAGATLVRAGHSLTTEGGLFGAMRLDGKRVDGNDIFRKARKILGLKTKRAGKLFSEDNEAADIDRMIRRIFEKVDADYDATEPAPDLEIEIKAAEVVRPQPLPALEIAR